MPDHLPHDWVSGHSYSIPLTYALFYSHLSQHPVRPLLWFPKRHMPGVTFAEPLFGPRVQTGSLGISFTSLKGCVIVITVAPILRKGKLRLRGHKDLPGLAWSLG